MCERQFSRSFLATVLHADAKRATSVAFAGLDGSVGAGLGRGRIPLLMMGRRRLMPKREHVTCSEPTVTPINSAISSRAVPRSTRFLICWMRSGVNLIWRPRLPSSTDHFSASRLRLSGSHAAALSTVIPVSFAVPLLRRLAPRAGICHSTPNICSSRPWWQFFPGQWSKMSKDAPTERHSCQVFPRQGQEDACHHAQDCNQNLKVRNDVLNCWSVMPASRLRPGEHKSAPPVPLRADARGRDGGVR